MKRSFVTIDLATRGRAIGQLYRQHGGGLYGVLCLTALLQTLAGCVPFLAWLTWPFLVYLASVLLGGSALRPVSVPLRWLVTLGSLRLRLTVPIGLLLYGVLSFLMYTALSDAVLLLPLSDYAAGFKLPILAVFPYAFAEGVVMLFISSCASRLAMDERDVFSLLATAVRDLVFSPLSCLVLILFHALIWANQVTHLAIWLKAPVLSTLLGHGVYSLIALLWALGCLRPSHGVETSDSELKIA